MSRRKNLSPPFSAGFNPRSRLSEVLEAGVKERDRVSRTVDISIPNPWLADYRNRLLKAAEEGARDQELLLAELRTYQKQLDELRDALEKLSDEKVAFRQRSVDALTAQLAAERERNAKLITDLDEANRSTVEAQRTAEETRASADQLKKDLDKKQQELDAAGKKEGELLERVTALSREVDQLEAKIVQLQVSKDVGDGDAAKKKEELQLELAGARQRLEASQEEAAEQKKTLGEAEQAFEDELQRNQELLYSIKEQNAGLTKELELVKGLTEAAKEGVGPSFSNEKKAVSGDL